MISTTCILQKIKNEEHTLYIYLRIHKTKLYFFIHESLTFIEDNFTEKIKKTIPLNL